MSNSRSINLCTFKKHISFFPDIQMLEGSRKANLNLQYSGVCLPPAQSSSPVQSLQTCLFKVGLFLSCSTVPNISTAISQGDVSSRHFIVQNDSILIRLNCEPWVLELQAECTDLPFNRGVTELCIACYCCMILQIVRNSYQS